MFKDKAKSLNKGAMYHTKMWLWRLNWNFCNESYWWVKFGKLTEYFIIIKNMGFTAIQKFCQNVHEMGM